MSSEPKFESLCLHGGLEPDLPRLHLVAGRLQSAVARTDELCLWRISNENWLPLSKRY